MTSIIARPVFADYAHLFPNLSGEKARSRWEALAHIMDSFVLDAIYGRAQNAVDGAGNDDTANGGRRLQWKEVLTSTFKRAAPAAERKES